MSRTRNERGQVVVLTVIALTVLLGMSALVLDVGAWFHSKRQLQATADASALAGAQMLPDTPGTAISTALDYANKNGGAVAGGDVTITSTNVGNDTISVAAKKQEPGFFARVFGLNVVDVGAKATALVGITDQAKYVAPMVVDCDHDLIKNCNNNGKKPEFNKQTTLNYDPMGAPGAFGMLNLGGDQNPGTSEEADWILHGFQNIRDALDARVNTVLLFPVYQTLNGQGQNAEYYIIGWIGFYLQSYEVHGNNATLTGYFTEYIAQGILASSGGGGPPNYGVKSIQLIG